MKTDNHKALIISAVAATVLLLAFQPLSAFNPQPEPPAVAKPGTQNYPGSIWKPAAAKPVTKNYPGNDWKTKTGPGKTSPKAVNPDNGGGKVTTGKSKTRASTKSTNNPKGMERCCDDEKNPAVQLKR